MKTKNDQSSYIKRSDLPLRPKQNKETSSDESQEQREREFMAAEIDEFGYFDFGNRR